MVALPNHNLSGMIRKVNCNANPALTLADAIRITTIIYWFLAQLICHLSTVCCEFGRSRLNGVGIGTGVARKLWSHRYSIDPCHFLWPNNDHLERRDARDPIFCASSHAPFDQQKSKLLSNPCGAWRVIIGFPTPMLNAAVYDLTVEIFVTIVRFKKWNNGPMRCWKTCALFFRHNTTPCLADRQTDRQTEMSNQDRYAHGHVFWWPAKIWKSPSPPQAQVRHIFVLAACH